MIQNNKKNKLSKKIILSTLALSSITGAIVTSLSFNQNYDNDKTLLEESSNPVVLSSNNNKTTRLATGLALKSTFDTTKYYPFQLNTGQGTATDSGNIFDFIEVTGSVQPATASSFSIEVLNRKNLDTLSEVKGTLNLRLTIAPYTDSSGTQINDTYQTTFLITDLRSVMAPTSVGPNAATPIDEFQYASNLTKPETAINYVKLANNIANVTDVAPSNYTTVLKVRDALADNHTGILTINAFFTNFVNSSGEFISGDSPIFPIAISGFKAVAGSTKLTPNNTLASQTNPSALPATLSEQEIINYFGSGDSSINSVITNPLTVKDAQLPILRPITTLKEVKVSNANDDNGTLDISMVVAGGYYDNELIPHALGKDSLGNDVTHTLNFTVEGFKKKVEVVDNTLTFVYIGVGGLAGVILIAVIMILLIRSQKKKNEEAKKRKSMEDRLSMASSGPKQAGFTPGAPGVGPAAGGAAGLRPGMAPGATPGGKYVPPTISVPKSNAPQAKRPSGPLPPKR